MGHCPDWQRQSYKKVKKMADGGDPSIPDLGYNPESENYESPVELSYMGGGKGSSQYGGSGRIGRTHHLDDDSSINVGVSGSHYKSGSHSGVNLNAVDATYRNKMGNFGMAFEPKAKRVQLTFYKEF